MSPSHSSGTDVTMALSGIVDHGDLNGPGGSMTPGHQHSLRCWLKSWPSAPPAVVTVGTLATQISMVPAAAGPWDPTMTTGDSSEPRHLFRL